MKTLPDALGTVKNVCGDAKHGNRSGRLRYRRKRERKTLNRDLTPSEPSNISTGTQNMKTGTDALGTAENLSGSAKHENGTQRPRDRRKRSPTAQNTKTGPDTLGTAEN
jgi:hypothetical protein